MALAAVVSLVAVTNNVTVMEYATAPPIWEKDHDRWEPLKKSNKMTTAIRLRDPAMATGFQETSFISNPPELQRIAAMSIKTIALYRLSITIYPFNNDKIILRALNSFHSQLQKAVFASPKGVPDPACRRQGNLALRLLRR